MTLSKLMRALGRDICEKEVAAAYEAKFGGTGGAAGVLEVSFEQFCELMNEEGHRPPSLEELEEAWDAFATWDAESGRFVEPAKGEDAAARTVDVETLKALLREHSEAMGSEEVTRLVQVIDELGAGSDAAAAAGSGRIGKDTFLKIFTPTSYRDMVAEAS